MLFLGACGIKFQIAHMNLLLGGDQIRLNACVAFTAGVHLFAEHAKAPLFILALLPNGVEAFASFSEVGLQGGFFQREFFDHRLQFRTASGITDGFGQFGCSLADLVFQLVDTAN